MNIFPNPSDDKLNITFELEEKSLIEISIYNVLSKKCYNKEFTQNSKGENKLNIDISKLEKGCYFIITKINNSQIQNKFIKK